MKSKAQRLAESYCRPQTEEECLSLKVSRSFIGDAVVYTRDGEISVYDVRDMEGMTEIPVSHFIDLLHDRIAPWRLTEDGFATAAHGAGDYKFNTLMGDVIISWDSLGDAMLITMDTDEPLENIATYTDLLTLIRLIG